MDFEDLSISNRIRRLLHDLSIPILESLLEKIRRMLNFVATAALAATVSATTIAEINGNRFISPLNGTSVTGVEGLVTAIGKNGVFLRSTTPDDDPTTSESLYVYTTALQKQVKVGDIITVDGKVQEYR